jgi:pectate lyase
MTRIPLAVALCAAITGTVALSATAAPGGPEAGSTATVAAPADALALARQVLPAGDGWASATGGTTGGSAAAAANVHVVSSRSELVTALGGNNATNGSNATPKIILVKGRVDANVDATDHALSCDDYAEGTGYSLAGYLAAYDPDGPPSRAAPWRTPGPLRPRNKPPRCRSRSGRTRPSSASGTALG